jgi:hypothetical protein
VPIRLFANARRSRQFFGCLFDVAVEIYMRRISRPECREVLAANERSLICAPIVAAAKFLSACRITVIQHGNPIADYLPTIADSYLCRSRRWESYLLKNAIVRDVIAGPGFPRYERVRHDPRSRTVVLLMHNPGYLEPNVDCGALAREISRFCRDRQFDLVAIAHPASKETYGVTLAPAAGFVAARAAVGFRTTLMDQLPADLPQASLLDYWPEFFLTEGKEGMLSDYLERVRGVIE